MTNKQENKGCGKSTLKKIFEEIEDLKHKDIDGYDKLFKDISLRNKAKGYIQRTKEELEFLVLIEDKLDELNGEKGDLCLYCNAEEYNGEVGIIHDLDCPILDLRTKIRNCKEIIKSGEENGIKV